jgi:hypothetical protein
MKGETGAMELNWELRCLGAEARVEELTKKHAAFELHVRERIEEDDGVITELQAENATLRARVEALEFQRERVLADFDYWAEKWKSDVHREGRKWVAQTYDTCARKIREGVGAQLMIVSATDETKEPHDGE